MGPVVPATRPSNRRKQLNLSILVKGVALRRAKAALAWMLRGSQLRPHSEPMAVPSARPIPFLRAVSFALLALALALGGVLLWSAQAQAQTATVLISNTAQTSRSLGVDLVANYPKYAQAFTTGTNVVGYTTDSVGVRFHTIGDTTTAGDQLTVTLNADNSGVPGDALCTLTDPATFTGSGVQTFDAPATDPCPTLAASTSYFVVIDRVTVTSTAVSLTETNIDNEDTGGAAGWSIADLHHHDDSGTWTPDPHGLTSQIVVKGTAVVPTVLISNTGQTADGTARAIASNGSTSRAQAFTTGAEAGGYTLNSLGIDFNNIASTSTAGGELSVTLNEDSSGDPGTALCTLADPATFSASGLHTFDAPTTDPCPTLAASTTYFAVVARAGTATDAIELKVTTNADEDSGGATGWSIGNDRHWITTQWSDTTAESHLIVVKGSAVAAVAEVVNSQATGVPTISGTPRVNEVLTADTSAIADDDGITTPNFTYQWVRANGMTETDVGTDSSTYTLTDDDANKQIKVEVSFTDDEDNAEGPLSSLPTDAVVPHVLVKNTGQSATTTPAEPNSTFPRYGQGFTTGPNAAGYTLGSIGIQFNTIADTSTAGSELTVTLNEVGSGLVTGAPGNALCTLTDPLSFSASGVHAFVTPKTGADLCPTLAASTTYFVVIARANNNASTISYNITNSDAEDPGGAMGWSIANGDYIFDGAIRLWGPGGANLLIEVKGPVTNSPATGAPSISGVLEQSEVLTADTVGIADPDGVGAPSYQWLAGGTAIPGATSATYTLTSAEVGDAISLTVTFTDG